MRDERAERVDRPRLLEAIGTLLLDGSPPADEVWPITSVARAHAQAFV
jgi:hypothetical protein